MSFTCTVCSLDIQVGEPMLSDERMRLAHKSCVDRMVDAERRAVALPPPPAPPPPQVVKVDVQVGGFGFGNPTASFEPCLLPSAPKICVVCQRSAISMCPACHTYVHQDYGYNGENCSGRHEAKCSAAAELRSPKYTNLPPLKHPIFIGEPVIVIDPSVAPLFRKNGKSHGKAKARKKGIRR